MTLSRDEWNERNHAVIEEFRANGGKIDRPILLLTTTGRRSGATRTNPLMYMQQGERSYVIASKQGSPSHPDWYHNLVANPDVTVERDGETYAARAIVLEGEERERVYAEQAELFPFFADYQRATSREIPVIALERRV